MTSQYVFQRFGICCVLLFAIFSYSQLHADSHYQEIVWMSDFEAASKNAQEKKIPIYLLFTAPEWCSFCRIMDEKIYSSSEFNSMLYGKCIFVQIILPKFGKLPQEMKKLTDRFSISSVPTALILSYDGKQEEIARFGYSRMDAKSFSEYVLSAL